MRPGIRRLLVGLVLCRGLVLLCVLPPFEGWDEYQHVGYVFHLLETGERPVLGQSYVSWPLIATLVQEFPHPRLVVETQLGRMGAVGYREFWARDGSPRARVPRFDHQELYQAQHSSFYYRLVAPLFAALGGVTNLRWSVGGLRLVNLGLTGAAVWIALGALGRSVSRPSHAILIGLAIAAQPLFLMNGVRVSSDALGVLLATMAVAQGLALGPDRFERRCVVLGLLTGGAILAKAVNFGLLPFVAYCGMIAVLQGQLGTRRALVAALGLALGLLVVLGAEFRFNLAHYGLLTPMQEAVVNRRHGRNAWDLIGAARALDWARQGFGPWLWDTYFAGGWSLVRPRPWAQQVYSFALLAGLLGWAGRGRGRTVFRSAIVPLACAVLCGGYTAALGYHAVQSQLAWGRPTTNPWYACAALPWFLMLAAGGGLAWPLGRLRPVVPVLLATSCLLGEAVAVWGRMVPLYSGGAQGGEALRRLAYLQPEPFGTPTLAAAALAEIVLLAAIWASGSRRPDGPLREVPRPGDVSEGRDAGMRRPEFFNQDIPRATP